MWFTKTKPVTPEAPSPEAAFAWKKLRDKADALNKKASTEAERLREKAHKLNLRALKIEKAFTALQLSVFEVWHKAEDERAKAAQRPCKECGKSLTSPPKYLCDDCEEKESEARYREMYPGDED